MHSDVDMKCSQKQTSVVEISLTLSQMTNFRLFQTEEFADDNFRFDQNVGKLSKRVENTVGKGEIARSEQFLLFPQCFQKTCCANTYKQGLIWEWEFTQCLFLFMYFFGRLKFLLKCQ